MSYETIEYKNYKINIENDSDINPRDDDNLGTMLCIHPSYSIGDKHSYNVEEIEKMANSKDYISLPLFLFNHSGLAIRTYPFNDRWDSGQIGQILVSKEEIRREYGWKNITAKRREQIENYLKGEVESCDYYLKGEIFYYTIVDSEDEIVGSCSDFRGTDFEKNGLLEYARNEIDGILNKIEKNEGVQLELELV